MIKFCKIKIIKVPLDFKNTGKERVKLYNWIIKTNKEIEPFCFTFRSHILERNYQNYSTS